MSEHLHLRDYQREAIDAVFSAWDNGMRRPSVVLPTGAGKTVIFAHIISEFIKRHKQRVMVLVHRDELADQAIAKIKAVAPDLDVGKVKAGSDDAHASVMVCSVQTLAIARRRERVASVWTGPVGLIITDECHHAAAASYRKIYDAFPGALHVGFTATMARGDKVGLGDVWDDVVYKRTLLWFIGRGFLTDVRGVSVSVDGLNLGSVKRSRGDYQSGDLGRALEESEMSAVLPKAYAEHAADRPGVVFTPTVATAYGVANAFNDAGIRTAVISGETPREERLQTYEDFRTGRVQVLSNCMVLTEGFDAPWASCAVIARPTQSNPLYIQMVGRVLRPWPHKKDALVLDVAGAGSGNKLATLIDLDPGVVRTVCDGESLTEAEEREQSESNTPSVSRSLDIKHADMDLFAGSSQSWLLTRAGVMFIPAGDGDVFLWASTEPGTWDVCYAPKEGKWQRIRTALPLGTATAWAETEAEERMSLNTARSASWRRKKASEAQLNLARNLGLDVPEGARSGDVGNLISAVFASRKFDGYVK